MLKDGDSDELRKKIGAGQEKKIRCTSATSSTYYCGRGPQQPGWLSAPRSRRAWSHHAFVLEGIHRLRSDMKHTSVISSSSSSPSLPLPSASSSPEASPGRDIARLNAVLTLPQLLSTALEVFSPSLKTIARCRGPTLPSSKLTVAPQFGVASDIYLIVQTPHGRNDGPGHANRKAFPVIFAHNKPLKVTRRLLH